MGVAAERIRGNCSEHVIGQLLFRWAWEECREFLGSQGGEEQLFFFSFPYAWAMESGITLPS